MVIESSCKEYGCLPENSFNFTVCLKIVTKKLLGLVYFKKFSLMMKSKASPEAGSHAALRREDSSLGSGWRALSA